jgi:hypothetical protein
MFPESDSTFPESGRIFPESGRLFPESGRMFPESGRMFPEGGRVVMRPLALLVLALVVCESYGSQLRCLLMQAADMMVGKAAIEVSHLQLQWVQQVHKYAPATHAGNFQCTFRERSVHTQGTFSANSGNNPVHIQAIRGGSSKSTSTVPQHVNGELKNIYEGLPLNLINNTCRITWLGWIVFSPAEYGCRL